MKEEQTQAEAETPRARTLGDLVEEIEATIADGTEAEIEAKCREFYDQLDKHFPEGVLPGHLVHRGHAYEPRKDGIQLAKLIELSSIPVI